jgi:hypothetical protein
MMMKDIARFRIARMGLAGVTVGQFREFVRGFKKGSSW